MPKETVVRPNGVITQPNEYGDIPPGSLSEGDGIQIRKQSVIEPRNSFDTYLPIDGTYNEAVKLWPTLEGGMLVVGKEPGSDTRLFHTSTSLGSAEVFYNESPRHFSFTDGKTHFSNTRQRTIVTSNDPPAITTTVVGEARQAGLPPLFVYNIMQSAVGSNWLANKYIGYAAVLRYEEDDGYIIRGPVSTKLVRNNTAGVDNCPVVSVSWPADVVVREGTVIEVYRVPQQDTAALLGDEYRLAFEYELNAGDVAVHMVVLLDHCLDSALSNYLYVNPSQEGAGKTNGMPPQSTDVVTHKGATFYVSADTTEQFTTRIPHKWGALSTAEEREFGIGGRLTTANLINGFTDVVIADATGVKAGQMLHSSVGLPGGGPVRITSVVGTTVTLASPATGTFPGTSVNIVDVVVIDGIAIEAAGPGEFVPRLGEFVGDIGGSVLRTMMFGNPTIAQDFVSVAGETLLFTQFEPDAPPFTIAATNGQNYSPALPEYGSTPLSSYTDPRTNRIHYSKIEQPEAVPPDNFFFAGSGSVLKLWGTQDSLFAFCTDGIFRIDGDGDDWAVRPFDPDVVLLHADAVDSMDDTIFAFTTAGLVSVADSGGVQKMSAPVLATNYRGIWSSDPPLSQTRASAQIACDKQNYEVWLNFNYEGIGWLGTLIWSTITKTFVTQSEETPRSIVYAPSVGSIILGLENLRRYDSTGFMPTFVVFNAIYGDDLGVLKQWIDVTLFFEFLNQETEFTPRFESVPYTASYTIPASAVPLDHVVAPLLTAVHGKHMRFGYFAEGTSPSAVFQPNYQLKGLTYRYRVAAEPLRQ
jgi:hypothetical protein